MPMKLITKAKSTPHLYSTPHKEKGGDCRNFTKLFSSVFSNKVM